MPLSVANSNAGGGLSNLLRQTRPAKSGDEASAAAQSEPSSAAALRQIGRAAIDSTGSNTAQIKATLTLYLSPLGGQEPAPEKTSVRGGAIAGAPASAARTGASDVLRMLDNFAPKPSRLTA